MATSRISRTFPTIWSCRCSPDGGKTREGADALCPNASSYLPQRSSGWPFASGDFCRSGARPTSLRSGPDRCGGQAADVSRRARESAPRVGRQMHRDARPRPDAAQALRQRRATLLRNILQPGTRHHARRGFSPARHRRAGNAKRTSSRRWRLGKGLLILACHTSNFDLGGIALAQWMPVPLQALSLADPTPDVEVFNHLRRTLWRADDAHHARSRCATR